MAQKASINVAIVDDDEGIRSSLAALIRRDPALRLAGDYPDAESALKEIPNRPPDVVLMDINLPGMPVIGPWIAVYCSLLQFLGGVGA